MSKNENRPLTGSTSRFAATLDQPALGKFDFSFAKKSPKMLDGNYSMKIGVMISGLKFPSFPMKFWFNLLTQKILEASSLNSRLLR